MAAEALAGPRSRRQFGAQIARGVDWLRKDADAVITRRAHSPAEPLRPASVLKHTKDRGRNEVNWKMSDPDHAIVSARLLELARSYSRSVTTLNAAAALGCQVAAVRPGQDLSSALYHDIGAGSR